MKTLPTLRAIARRRRRRHALLAGALTSVLVAAACGGAMNYSQDARFSPDQGITDGIDPLMRGKRHFANRNFGLAIEAFEEARQLAPQSVNVLNALAVAYEEIGRTDLADSYFLEALDIAPSSAQTYNNWAMVQLGRGNPSKAEQLLAEASRLAPGDPMVVGNIARLDATGQGDGTMQPEPATGALTTVIAELQPKPEEWAPSIRSVAPHISFLQTTPPDGAPAAAASDGTVPTLLYPQVAAADIAPMPDPSIEQAPPPPAVPIAPVIEFELDNPAAADAALVALATAEAGRTIVPVGVSSAESDDAGGRIVRPGGAAIVPVVEDADAMLASLQAPLREQEIQPGAVIVSAELRPADVPPSVPVGSWVRQDLVAISSAAEDAIGEVVTVAAIPADATVIRPGVDPVDAAPAAKLIGIGETIEPVIDPGRVIVPVPAWSADEVSTGAVTPPMKPEAPSVAMANESESIAVEPVIDPDRVIVPVPAWSADEVSTGAVTPPMKPEAPSVAMANESESMAAAPDETTRTVAVDPPVVETALQPMPAALTVPADDEFLSVAAVLPPSARVAPVVVDASARIPMIVAVFARTEPVAPETAVADNVGAASLPLASAARIPSVVAVLAMVEAGAESESTDVESGSDQ